jgi:hypothetical protein
MLYIWGKKKGKETMKSAVKLCANRVNNERAVVLVKLVGMLHIPYKQVLRLLAAYQLSQGVVLYKAGVSALPDVLTKGLILLSAYPQTEDGLKQYFTLLTGLRDALVEVVHDNRWARDFLKREVNLHLAVTVYDPEPDDKPVEKPADETLHLVIQ